MGLFRRGRRGSDGGGGGDAAAQGALEPIAGISLERYAELCVKMKDVGTDPDACAAIAEAEGVDRASWEAAQEGWNARMNDTATAAAVALAYMPLYQDALLKWGGPPVTATFEDYIEMSALINTDLRGEERRPTDLEAMYARFGIDAVGWSQISTHWVDRLIKDPQLQAEYAERTRARVVELDAEHLARVHGQ